MIAGPGETLDCLCGHWKIFQLRKGHRYSTDDLLTAWFATDAFTSTLTEPSKLLDLGCGVGSIGLLLLWQFPRLRLVGIEAQQASVELARRSIRYNGLSKRSEIRWADFRAPEALSTSEQFDLVTGSPPYLRAAEGRRSLLPQRGACRFEDRGGIDAYLRRAQTHLAPGGIVAWVHATRYTDASLQAARDTGLPCVVSRPVVFREGKEGVVTLFRATAQGAPGHTQLERLVVRGRGGSWSCDYAAVRQAMGYPA